MNKDFINKIADEILFFEFIQKQAGSLDLKKDYNNVNKMFSEYITNKKFPLNGKQVPYSQLDSKFKEKVWNQFWEEISANKSIGRIVEETIQKMLKQPVAI